MSKNPYSDLTEALASLNAQGYENNFRLKYSCLKIRNTNFKILPGEFDIDQQYNFDCIYPEDSSVIYAVSCPKHNLKGVIIDGCGEDSRELSQEMKIKFSNP